MHTRKIIIVVSILFVTLSINAQSNFKRGYIITNQGDSVTGLIDFRTDAMNSRFCRFKQSDSAPEQLYYPGDISRYRFLDEWKYYVSHTIKINGEDRKAFLEYLVYGVMNLYYYSDSSLNQNYYFFEDEKGTLTAITKNPDEIVDGKIIPDNKYLGKLTYLFRDCPDILDNINKISFDRSSMIHLAKEYHELTCTSGEKCIYFENDSEKQYVKFNFSLYGGVQFQKYSFGARQGLNNFGPTESISPVIGSQVDITFPRIVRSLALQLDLALSGMKGETDNSNNKNVYRKYEFETLVLSGRLDFKYTYPNGKWRPVVEAGLSMYNFFNCTETMYTETRYGEEVSSYTETQLRDKKSLSDGSAPAYLPTLSFGYNCGVGVDYQVRESKALFLRVSYEQIPNFDKITALQLKLGYTF